MTDVSISKSSVEDVPAILSIQAECGLSAWTTAAYETEVERRDSVVLAARTSEGDILGFVSGRVIAGDEGSGAEAEIYNIGVRPAARLRRVGSSLLRSFLGHCAKFGVYNVWLDVRVSNREAISFYKTHGFVIVGRRPRFYTGPDEDAEIMVLRLPDSPQEQSGKDA